LPLNDAEDTKFAHLSIKPYITGSLYQHLVTDSKSATENYTNHKRLRLDNV